MSEIILFRLMYSVYAALLLYVWLFAISDYAFNKKSGIGVLGKRILLSPFWLVAVMSPAGRKFLFNNYVKKV